VSPRPRAGQAGSVTTQARVVPARMEIRAVGGTVKLDFTDAVITRPGRGLRLVPFYLLRIWSWRWDGVPLGQGRTWPNRTSSP